MSFDLYARHVEPVRFRAGEVIFRKGDAGDVLYVIGEGEIELVMGEHVAVRLREGDMFGEMSIIDQEPRSADAAAVTDVVLFPINRGLFLVLVQDTPHFALEVMKSLADRVRRANPV